MKNAHFYTAPSRRETRNGWIYYVISYLALPFALNWVSAQLAVPLSEAKLNFVYYCINFAAAALIFRRFLADSLRSILRKPFQTLWYAVLGYLGAEALSEMLTWLLLLVLPGYANVNDMSITAMVRAEPLLAIAVVFLVPVAEECFFRGLLFRNLYSSSSVAAYLVSMAAFSAVHVIGYIGTVSPLYLLVSFLVYLPAGYCLAWCYHQTGSFAAPLLMHTLVNAMGVFAMTR